MEKVTLEAARLCMVAHKRAWSMYMLYVEISKRGVDAQQLKWWPTTMRHDSAMPVRAFMRTQYPRLSEVLINAENAGNVPAILKLAEKLHFLTCDNTVRSQGALDIKERNEIAGTRKRYRVALTSKALCAAQRAQSSGSGAARRAA